MSPGEQGHSRHGDELLLFMRVIIGSLKHTYVHINRVSGGALEKDKYTFDLHMISWY